MSRRETFTGLAIVASMVWIAAFAACNDASARISHALESAVAIGAGADFTCALTANGSVWCWGRNELGQLGRGRSDADAHPVPGRVALPVRVRSLGVGYDHACATTAEGVAYCWGDDSRFQSGVGESTAMCTFVAEDTPCRPRPVRVKTPVLFRYVSAGYRESCGIAKDDGHIHCWGDANVALSSPDSAFLDVCSNAANAFACRSHPRLVPVLISEPQVRPPVLAHFDSLALGVFRSCGIMNPGRLYCWGRGVWASASLSQQALAVGNVVRNASIGFEHACAVRSDWTVACYGPRDLGALALGAATGPLRTTRNGRRVEQWERDVLPSIRDADAVDGGRMYDVIAAGALHTCAVERISRRAWCWGANQYGQLGVGMVDSGGRLARGANPSPRVVHSTAQFSALASGTEHVCGISSGHVLCWGRNLRGAAGDAGDTNITSPHLVASFARDP